MQHTFGDAESRFAHLLADRAAYELDEYPRDRVRGAPGPSARGVRVELERERRVKAKAVKGRALFVIPPSCASRGRFLEEIGDALFKVKHRAD